MKIDVVYVVGKGSNWQDNELRYSLRSLAKYVRGIRQVWVVGHRPDWCTAEHLPCEDPYRHSPDANIIHKTMAAACCPKISSEFLFCNDDHYFLSLVRACEFPFYHAGPLFSGSTNYKYVERIAHTRQVLTAMNRPARHFDVHAPIRINRLKFEYYMGLVDWVGRNNPGLCMKSTYANQAVSILSDDLRMFHDCKLTSLYAHLDKNEIRWLLAGRPCFSSAPTVPPIVRKVLESEYPKPSPWEMAE